MNTDRIVLNKGPPRLLLVSSFFITNFLKGLSDYFGRKINDYKSLENAYLYSPKSYPKRILLNLLKGGRIGDVRAYVTLLQYLCVRYELHREEEFLEEILHLTKKLGIDTEYFNKIRIEVALKRNEVL